GGPAGGGGLPDVEDLAAGHEDVEAVAEEPQRSRRDPAGGDQLAVVDPGAVPEGDADTAALEHLERPAGHGPSWRSNPSVARSFGPDGRKDNVDGRRTSGPLAVGDLYR